jgi:hypothetical protein
MAGIRLADAGPLWRDECALVQLAQLPNVSDILREFPHEAFPPPFPILIRLWIQLFGDNDIAFRIYGFLVAVALVLTLWVVFRSLKAGVPLLSLGCILLSAGFLLWGTSVRGYGVGAVLIVLTFGLTGGALAEPGVRRFVSAFAASLLSVQILLQNIVLLLAIGLAGIIACLSLRNARLALGVAGAMAISLASFLPYVGSYLGAKEWSLVVQSPKAARSISYQLGEFLGNIPKPGIWLVEIGLLGLLGLAAWRIFLLRRSRAPQLRSPVPLFVLLGFLLAVPISEMLFRILKYNWQAWYSLAPFSIAFTATDLLIVMLWKASWVRLTRVALAIIVAVALAWTNWPRLFERQTNIDVVARELNRNAAPNDLIVVNPWQLGIPFGTKYHGQAAWLTVPNIEDHRFHRYDLIKTKMMSPNPIADVMDVAAGALRSGHRVWLVGGANFAATGQTAAPLPPAPQSKFGWDNIAYGWSWNQELGRFIEQHTMHGTRVELADVGPVNPVEKVPLVVAEGWKD